MSNPIKTGITGYFAAEADPKTLVGELRQRWDDYQAYLVDTGRMSQAQASWARLYGFDPDGKAWTTEKVSKTGKKGALLKAKVNHYGSIFRQIINTLTAQQPVPKTKAKNTNAASTSVAALGDRILEEALKEKRLKKQHKRVLARALAYRKAYIEAVWDPHAGAEISPKVASAEQVRRDPETLEVLGTVREGDVRCRVYTFADVAYDHNLSDDDDVPWLLTRRFENKYELAAIVEERAQLSGEDPQKAKELADRIRSTEMPASVWEFRLSGSWSNKNTKASKDLVPVYEFWHRDTRACGGGRHLEYVGEDIVLQDEALEYRDSTDTDYIPVFPLTAQDLDDTADGHSPMFDLLVLQEVMDATASNAITKSAKSLPVMVTARTAKMSKKDIDSPYTTLEVEDLSQMPQMFEPTVSPEQDVALMGVVQRHMETLSGMNATVRGQVEGTIKSGTHAAYIGTQAILSQTDVQANYHELIELHGAAYLRAHQLFNQAKRSLRKAAGIAGSYMLQAFDGKDLEGIEGVSCEAVSPLQQTIAGRQEMLAMIEQNGVPMDPAKKLAFLKTGQYDNPLEDALAEDQFIRQENEHLAAGKPIPPASVGENHYLHLISQRPKSITDKLDEAVHTARIQHCLSHLAQVRWDLLTPEQVMQLGAFGFGPPPAPPAAPPGGAPPAKDGGGEPPANAGPAPTGEPQAPQLPSMPDGTELPQQVQQAAANTVP